MPGNVVLIGFSGSGKSSVGRLLARTLDWPLIDTDQQIVDKFGKSIAQIFRDEGEQVFRSAESTTISAACDLTGQVVSVGGGAPVNPDNRHALRTGNFVVRLDAPPKVLLDRLLKSPNAEERPMLAGDDALGRIRGLLAERTDAYAIADATVDTVDRSPEDVASEIVHKVDAWVRAQGDPS